MSHRRTALVAATAVLLLAPACGSSDAGGSASKNDPSASAEAGDESSSAAAEGNPGKETTSEEEAGPDKTITWTADKTWDKESLTVAAGEVFTFAAASDAGTAAVTFDGSNSYTMSGGLVESFTLSEPGTYTVKEFVTGAPVTITVTK